MKEAVGMMVKDIVFRLIFSEDKEALLQLYNVLNGTAYTDIGKPNMPVRFLIYLAKEYQLLVDKAKDSLYGKELIPLPTPKCVVFYNGTAETQDEYELRLSSAFTNQGVEPDVEVVVRVININYGRNEYLMQGCDRLQQYAQFVAYTREYAKVYNNLEDSMNAAIDYCIEHGILEDILRKHRSQVLGSLLEDFDKEKYERTLRKKGREEGYELGKRDGQTAGYEFGRQDGQTELLHNLMTNMKISEEEAREKLGL